MGREGVSTREPRRSAATSTSTTNKENKRPSTSSPPPKHAAAFSAFLHGVLPIFIVAFAFVPLALAQMQPQAFVNKTEAVVRVKAAALNRTLDVASTIASLIVPNTTVVLPGPQGPYLPRKGLPTVAFTGSAGLFIFYAGVAQGLIEKGLLVPGASRMNGLSGGAITSAVVAAGVPPAALLASYDESPIFCNATLADDWATNGGKRGAEESLARFVTECLQTAEWPLSRVGKAMTKLIPAGKVQQVSDTVQIWASQVNPLNYKARVASPLGPFSSKEDLITKIQASSDLPCLVSGKSYTIVNTTQGEKPFIDGGGVDEDLFLRALGTPDDDAALLCLGASETNPCITVTALQLGPNALVPARDPLGRCYDNVLIPPVSTALPSPLFGYASYPAIPKSKWKESEACDIKNYLGVLSIEESLVPPLPTTTIDINPGKRTPLPLTPCEWRSYRLGKANATISKLIYDHGRNEALAFAAAEYGL